MEDRPELESTALRLAERLIQLLDEGSFSATYKYAVLVGLMDLCMELSSATGSPPEVITTRQIAEKIIELYWPHSALFRDDVVRQTAGGQAEIVKAIVAFRGRFAPNGGRSASLTRARADAGPDACESLARLVEWKLVEMPLPKLQIVGGEEDLFLYRYGFNPRMENRRLLERYWRGDYDAFDNRLLLRSGVGASLVALNGVIRPLIHHQWAVKVARMNRIEEAELESFLFGPRDRSSMIPVRSALCDLQDQRCFYCGERFKRTIEVDHFIPWSRHPDNGIHNLVVADAKCNNDKRHHLAAAEHVERWRERSMRHETDLGRIAVEQRWDLRPERTIGGARAIYAALPEGARLWQTVSGFVPIDKVRIGSALAM